MSEQHGSSTEHNKQGEVFQDDAEAHQERHDKLKEEAAEAAQEHNETVVDELEDAAESQATSAKEITVEQVDTASDKVLYNSRELRSESYNRKLKQVQSKLSAPERSFSKLVHQRFVSGVSDAGAKTIARPAGILGGGIAALVGSVVLVYMTRHYGFAYNYLVFFMLFGIGYVAGLLVEILVKLFNRRRT